MTLYQASPTFITMDIEGEELAAIKGAKKIICENKPSLAVCVYYYPEQVADVIDQISKFNSEYLFFYPKLHRIPNRDCTVRYFSR